MAPVVRRHEMLGFIHGDVPAYPMPDWVWGDQTLVSSARLLRRLHDATVGCDPSGPWRSPVHEPAEVICHNDFAPYSCVFEDGRAVGVSEAMAEELGKPALREHAVLYRHDAEALARPDM
jgi:hypothetical protein